MSNSGADSSGDERETKRKRRSSGGVMNFMSEFFWRKQQQDGEHEEENEEDQEEEVAEPEVEENESDAMEPGEDDQKVETNHQEVIDLQDDDDDDDATVPEEDEDGIEEDGEDEESTSHFQDEQNLTQLTPSEASHHPEISDPHPSQATACESAVPPSSVADDSSIHNTELGEDDEGHETISNAPSDFENQLNASNLQSHDEDHENDGEGNEGLFYKGQLIYKMSYRDLGRHLKALGLRAVGKQHVLRASLVRAVKKGMEAPDDVQSQASTVEPRTPKRKRSMESPPSSRVKRSTRINTLQAGSVRIPTRLASARKTQNSQKDSYLTTPEMLSPHHHHNSAYHSNEKKTSHRRKSTRRKGSRAAHQDEEDDAEQEESSHYETSQTVEDTPRHEPKSSSSLDQHEQNHEEDPDSELDHYYSPAENEPEPSTPLRLPESRSLSSAEIPSSILPRYESSNKFDYEDLTDSVSIVDTASVAATNGSALSPVHNFSNENENENETGGSLSTMPLDHLPPPQRYPQYLMRNRNASTTDPSSSNGGQQMDQPHTTSQHSDDDVSSIISYPEPNSSFSPPDSTSRLHENRSRGPSSEGSTPFEDALGAVGSRFVAMLRGGEQLSDAEYSFFKSLLESKRPPSALSTAASAPVVLSPVTSTPVPEPQPQPPVIIAPAPAPVKVVNLEERSQAIESRKATAVDTSVQTEDEDYERKKRTFSETEDSLSSPLAASAAATTSHMSPAAALYTNARDEEEPQSNKRRKGSSSPLSVPQQSYPPFQSFGYRSPPTTSTEPEPDREWMAPRRHSFLPSHPHSQTSHLPKTPFAFSTPRPDDSSFYRPTPPVPSPQSALPISLQVQHQSLSQSNQTAAISSVQRRLMRRRTTFQSSNDQDVAAESRRSSANGVVAKRILDTLGEITATLDEQRKKPQMVTSPSTPGPSANNRVRFLESTPHSKSSHAGLSVRDRISTPKPPTMTPTPSQRTPISTPNNFTPNGGSGRDSVESTEPLWTRERGRTGGPSMSPPMSSSASSSRNTTPVQSQPHTPKFSQSKATEAESPAEFTFNAPKDIEGLEDEEFSSSYNLSAASSANRQVRFVFSPPAKKVSKKFPPTPGGPKLRPLASTTATPVTKEKSSDSSSGSSLPFNGLPESLVKRSNSIKCPVCMVFNDKTAERCVACESKLPKSDSDAASKSSSSAISSTGSSNSNGKSGGFPDALINRANSVKCSVCMVFNDKTAERCVACESKLNSGSSSDSAASSKPVAPAPAPSSTGSGFSFGSSSASAVSFGASKSATQPPSSTTLSFGSSSTTPISFGKPATVVPKENSETSTLAKPSTTGVSFGSSAPASTSSGFSFGSAKPTPPVASVGLSFGAKPPADTTPAPAPASSSSGFSFGTKPPVAASSSSQPETSAPSSTTGAKSFTGFSFGSAPTAPAAPVAPTTATPASGLSFGSSPINATATPSFGGFGAKPKSDEKDAVSEGSAKPSASTAFSSFGGAGKSFTGFGAAPGTEKKSEEAKPKDSVPAFQAFQSSSSTNPAKPSSSFGSFSSSAREGSDAAGEERGKKRQAFGSEQSAVVTKPAFSFGGNTTTAPVAPAAPAGDSKPAPAPAASPFAFGSSVPKFGSSTLPATPFGQSTATSDAPKSSSGFSFGSSSSAPSAAAAVNSTPGPFGKFGSTSSSSSASQPFGQSLTRASSVATPPPPPPMGSESPGNMDTGYGGDTSSIPSNQLPPPSNSSFGSSSSSSFAFGGTKPSFSVASPSPSPFGGFGATPSTPSQAQPFGMFGNNNSTSATAASRPNLAFGAGASGASGGFGSIPTPVAPSFSSPMGGGMGMGGMGAQPFGQSPMGLGAPGGGGGAMFNMGVPEKGNQAGGPKGRRKVKPTWKPA